MSSGGQIVPPGQHPPFAVVTGNDHRAWILVAAALGVSFTLVTIITRILIRLFVNRGWGVDDTLCVCSTIISWIQAGLVLASARAGMGRAVDLISSAPLGTVQQSYYASNIFYIIASDLSKLSVVFFLRRLASRGSRLRTFLVGLMIALPVSTAAFIVATSLQCDLLAPWDIVGESCPNWFLRWQIHGAVECIFEVLICAAPVWLVWNLQTGVENKIEVILPFALRLILIIFTGLRLGSFRSSGLDANFTLREAPYICWTQAELSYSIIAATIPTARRLMLDFITYYNGGNFGTSGTRTGGGGSRGVMGASSQNEGIPMKNFRGTGRRKSEMGYGGATLRSRNAREGEGEVVVSDGDSQELIIRKDMDISIRVDNDKMNGKQEHPGRPNFM